MVADMPYAPFVPLRVFSSYTMLDGAVDPKMIAKTAAERGFPAVAITDRNGLYGSVAFAKACKDLGVQPVIGTMLGVVRPERGGAATPGQMAPTIDWLALYAQDATGYDNLCHLVSRAHLDRPLEFAAHVRIEDLTGHTDGLICLSGGGEGAITRLLADGQQAAADSYADAIAALFPGRFYIELCRQGDPVEERAEPAVIDLAYARDWPLVATNPARFADCAFYPAHDAMLCIASSTHVDSTDRPRSSQEWWIKPAPVMEDLFRDIPEALANTLVVAQRCTGQPPKRKPILPSLAGDQEGEARMCGADSRLGLVRRMEPYYPADTHPDLAGVLTLGPGGQPAADDFPALVAAGIWDEVCQYRDRLEFEVGIINRMGFGGYFLIVADFIKWAKERAFRSGPGADRARGRWWPGR